MGRKRNKGKNVEGAAKSSANSENSRSRPQLAMAPTNSNASIQRSVAESMNAVFSNDMLREMIVAQVIQNEIRRGFSRNDLRAVRRVAKSWLLDANKYLLATGQPLIKIELTRENSLSASPQVQQNGGKLLDRFTRAMISPTRVETGTPPLSLRIRPDFFREENRQGFSDFLARFATGLVGLHVAVPRNGGSMNLLFPRVNLAFPHLRKFKIAFPPTKLSLGEEENERSCSGSNFIALPFIQSILNGCQKLNEMRFPFIGNVEDYIPEDIRYLNLPPNITTLDVEGFHESSEFEALLHFDLPNLHTLTLCIQNKPYAEGLLSRILENFRTLLQQFRICDTGSDPPHHPPHLFRFLRMEKLTTCFFRCRYAELEGRHPPLQDSLPNLEQLDLGNQTNAMLHKWMEFSTFSNVHTLALEIMDGSPPLSCHFPALETLTLKFLGNVDFASLNDTLAEMPQLLHLYIILNDSTEVGSVDEWDSFLTGIPLEMIKRVRANSNFWTLKRRKQFPLPSIQQMADLQLLTLICYSDTEQESLISDLAFQFAFTQVPTLRQLWFQGRFRASAQMARFWRETGCVLREDGYCEPKDEMEDNENNEEEDDGQSEEDSDSEEEIREFEFEFESEEENEEDDS